MKKLGLLALILIAVTTLNGGVGNVMDQVGLHRDMAIAILLTLAMQPVLKRWFE